MIKLPKSKRGFTLVELMIVITVIAILATIAVVSFTRVQKQARDTKRKAEIKSTQTALQVYFTEKQYYPKVAPVVPDTPGEVKNVLTELVTTYMSSLPTAPKGTTGINAEYMYVTDVDGFKYGLCVILEAPTGSGARMWKVSTADAAGSEVDNIACTAQ